MCTRAGVGRSHGYSDRGDGASARRETIGRSRAWRKRYKAQHLTLNTLDEQRA
jgi:hypothetical protein